MFSYVQQPASVILEQSYRSGDFLGTFFLVKRPYSASSSVRLRTPLLHSNGVPNRVPVNYQKNWASKELGGRPPGFPSGALSFASASL